MIPPIHHRARPIASNSTSTFHTKVFSRGGSSGTQPRLEHPRFPARKESVNDSPPFQLSVTVFFSLTSEPTRLRSRPYPSHVCANGSRAVHRSVDNNQGSDNDDSAGNSPHVRTSLLHGKNRQRLALPPTSRSHLPIISSVTEHTKAVVTHYQAGSTRVSPPANRNNSNSNRTKNTQLCTHIYIRIKERSGTFRRKQKATCDKYPKPFSFFPNCVPHPLKVLVSHRHEPERLPQHPQLHTANPSRRQDIDCDRSARHRKTTRAQQVPRFLPRMARAECLTNNNALEHMSRHQAQEWLRYRSRMKQEANNLSQHRLKPPKTACAAPMYHIDPSFSPRS